MECVRLWMYVYSGCSMLVNAVRVCGCRCLWIWCVYVGIQWVYILYPVIKIDKITFTTILSIIVMIISLIEMSIPTPLTPNLDLDIELPSLTNIPTDLFMLIFAIIPLPDKRHLTMCNKQYNKIDISLYEDKFRHMINKSFLINTQGINLTRMEKNTLEFIYYDYVHLIPDRYYSMKNTILYQYAYVTIYLVAKNYKDIVKKIIQLKTQIITSCQLVFDKYNIVSKELFEYLRNANNSFLTTISYGAALGGHIDMLQWIVKSKTIAKLINKYYCNSDETQSTYNICSNYAHNRYMYEYAAHGNNLHILKWLLSNCAHNERDQLGLSTICPVAALNGNTKILKWAYDNNIEFTPSVFSNAVLNGDIRILSKLLKFGCQTDTAACESAAKIGRLDILQWLRKKGCKWDSNTCAQAAIGGHLEILNWAYSNGCDMCNISYVANNCVHQTIFEWFRFKNYKFDKNAYNESIVRRADITLLKWLYQVGTPVSEKLCEYAATHGKFEILVWARAMDFPWDEMTTFMAAKNGYLEILIWVFENGCCMADNICSVAALWNRTEILKWLLQHKNHIKFGVENSWDFNIIPYATFNGNFEMAKMAYENGCKFNGYMPIYPGSVEIMQWAHQNGCPTDNELCIEIAAEEKYELLEWMLENGYVFDDTEINYDMFYENFQRVDMYHIFDMVKKPLQYM